MSLRFFGTDGIRGPYGGDNLNDEIAFKAGVAAVRVARSNFGNSHPVIVVGRDTRASGEKLLAALAKGVALEGGSLIDLGIAPTPCVAFGARMSDALLGVSITASHNPASDNGIKFFDGDGVKPSQSLEQALDDAIGEAAGRSDSNAAEAPVIEDGCELRQKYAEALLTTFSGEAFNGKKVALDCANGAMSEIAPLVFRKLGADVTVIGDTPNGSNINSGVGSEHREALRGLMGERDFDLGFAFDGDGDRLVLFDEAGKTVPGEAILAVLALSLKKRGELWRDTLVTTVQSNLGLDVALKGNGIDVVRTDVGDKHIVREMLKVGYTLGGEESGHVVCGKFAITGDGLAASLELCRAASEAGQAISEVVKCYLAFPQCTKAIKVESKPSLDSCPTISRCIGELTESLGQDGRLLVRYSGTEPKIRLLVEARDQSMVDSATSALIAAVEQDLSLV